MKKAYFGFKVGNQNKQWAPHIGCKACVEHLRQLINGKKGSLQFGFPLVWREPKIIPTIAISVYLASQESIETTEGNGRAPT